MNRLMENSHIPSVCALETRYSSAYGQWLKAYDWTYILTLRRHIPLTEAACLKMAGHLLHFSRQVNTIWMALEQDRGDSMNHLHIILETGELRFNRKEMVEALGIHRNPKTLSYFSPVDSSNAVSMYCTKHIGDRLLYHNIHTQNTKHLI